MSAIERLFVVDPVRHDRRGHHWHFAEGALREASRRGMRAAFFVAKDAAGRALPAGDFHPIFRHGLYRTVTGNRNESIETDYRIGTAAIRDDLLGCIEFDPTERDLVMVPTASFRTIGGILSWRKETKCPVPIAFYFHFLLPPNLSIDPDSAGYTIARETAVAVRDSLKIGPVFLTTSSQVLAGELSAAMNCDVTVVPLPLWYNLAENIPAANDALDDRFTPTITFLGALRHEKGGQVLPAVFKGVLSAGRAAKFIVQAGIAEPGLMPPLLNLEKTGEVEIVRRILPEDQYVQLIAKSSAIILPYDRVRYRGRTSGQFAFATAIGRPSIVPDNTWMAEKIESGWAAGTIYTGDTSSDIARAVETTIAGLRQLGEAARSHAERWRTHESGSAHFTELLDWAARETRRQTSGLTG